MRKTHKYTFGSHTENVTDEQAAEILRVNPRAEIVELPKAEELPELKEIEKTEKEKSKPSK
jgi:hypothetical protein